MAFSAKTCRRIEPRLAILSSEFPPGPGGIGTHAFQVARGLSESGWKVLAVAPQDYVGEEQAADFNASQPFGISSLGRAAAGRVVSRSLALSRAVARFDPDVVLATGKRFAWFGAGVARRAGLPYVAVGHGTEFGDPGAWESPLTRLAFGNAAEVVCVSRFTWDRMLDFGVRPRGGRVITNGADHDRFRPLPDAEVVALRERLGLAGRRVLLTIGNVTERKGQEVVVRALPEVVRRFPDALYVMAGLPTREAEVSALARRLGVADHVRFLGPVDADDVVGLANLCDVFVMTSRRTRSGDVEGFGIAVIEAALCGKPAVVTSGSGLVEAVDDGLTGIAVPEGDAEATAAAILSLLEDDGRRLAMGEAARERALGAYTWTRKIAEYDELLRGVARV